MPKLKKPNIRPKTEHPKTRILDLRAESKTAKSGFRKTRFGLENKSVWATCIVEMHRGGFEGEREVETEVEGVEGEG